MNDRIRASHEVTAHGGADDFEVFFATYGRQVAAIVALTTRDLPLAEAATQGAKSRALQLWQPVGSLSRPDLWVIGVATRLAIDGWRRRRREVQLVPGTDSSPPVDILGPLLLKWGLEKLSPQ